MSKKKDTKTDKTDSFFDLPKEKFINIFFSKLLVQSGVTPKDSTKCEVTISVEFNLKARSLKKYHNKRLTIKDLNNLIEARN